MMTNGTLKQMLKRAEDLLVQQGISDASIDAWYLLEYVTCLSRTAYFLNENERMTNGQLTLFRKLVAQRMHHVPLQYLTGRQEFMGLEFHVTQDVLIPRQDTELLVELALPFCDGRRVLDLCTGSGCIIISIAKLAAPSFAAAIDLSRAALDIAKDNAKKLDAEVTFTYSNMFENVIETYDVIVSNPPYIPTNEIRDLMPEVREHEPVLALDGSEDGLYFYRILAAEAGAYLSEKGRVFFEIGSEQGAAVQALLIGAGFEEVRIYKDLAGLDRVITGRKR